MTTVKWFHDPSNDTLIKGDTIETIKVHYLESGSGYTITYQTAAKGIVRMEFNDVDQAAATWFELCDVLELDPQRAAGRFNLKEGFSPLMRALNTVESPKPMVYYIAS